MNKVVYRKGNILIIKIGKYVKFNCRLKKDKLMIGYYFFILVYWEIFKIFLI